MDEFIAYRLDESYAAAHRAMNETRHRLPEFAPQRVLDFGAGLSPVAWAAQAVWPEAPLRVCAVEPNAELREQGAELCAVARTVPRQAADATPAHWSEPLRPEDEYEADEALEAEAPLPSVAWLERLPTPDEEAPFDLVTASGCLGSLPPQALPKARGNRVASVGRWAEGRRRRLVATRRGGPLRGLAAPGPKGPALGSGTASFVVGRGL